MLRLGTKQPLAVAFFRICRRISDSVRVYLVEAESIAHTLPYDCTIVQDNQRGKPLPVSQWASVTVPAPVMDGGQSPSWMRHANRSLAASLPNAQYRTLDGQTHMLEPKAHAPMLVEFFNG